RNLHRSAKICIDQHGGDLPRDLDALAALPGIGRSTAAAILAQAFGERHAILDGNVRRVLARWHGVHGWPGATAAQRSLWMHAEEHTPQRRIADYTQAIMDLGATLCTRTRPQCVRCPVATGCIALRDGLTSVLPQSKPKRSIPTRSTTMLIVRDTQDRVLLERRPPTGVWARLWSLPEIDDASAAIGELLRHYAVDAKDPTLLDSFVHTFSHYHLRITPLLLAGVSNVNRIADDTDRGWYSREQLGALGLPAPVRKLLEPLP
ncbi:MAG: NUDIX domain-containing protein, partial [Dokdonella sp.]